MKMYTIVFLKRNGVVTLARKKHKIGAGKLTTYGGGIEPDEKPLDSAIRELREESGIVAEYQHVEFMATMDFFTEKADAGAEKNHLSRCLIFVVHEWQGDPQESKEMGLPEQFKVDELPLDRMMVGDDVWIPRVLRGEHFIGALLYDEDQLMVLRSEFHPVGW